MLLGMCGSVTVVAALYAISLELASREEGLVVKEIFGELAVNEIYGPDSDEVQTFEARLARYFERVFQYHAEQNLSASKFVSSDGGSMMEETIELMDRHYDQSIELFLSFLDRRFQAYSMAYYGEDPISIKNSPIQLEEAQRSKFDLIVQRAQITGDERILNIGCGFGSLETYLLERFPDIRVVGVTPSLVQIAHLKKRMGDPSDPISDGRFSLVEGAFDKMSLSKFGKNPFDLVISVAVFEQVINMRQMLSRIGEVLAPQGKSFHHLITSQRVVPRLLDPRSTRIDLYFPGGRAWPHSELARHTDVFDLMDTWFVNGLNYWRTLGEWQHRFWSNVPQLYGRVLDLDQIRHWSEYFSLSKAMFAALDGSFYGNSHYLFRLRN
jgi:cyclopropane-fatty-acyl-phospholipid synthase